MMNFLELFNKPNLIAAHRGDNSQKPENTFAALSSSVGKCDFVEVDVQLSKDLVPVIMHDDTLARTSNVSKLEAFSKRSPWRVSDFTLEELQGLDFGTWFNGEYEPLLTLEKLLSFVKEEKLFMNVEIKDMSKTFSDELVIQIIMDMIAQSKSEPYLLLSSFYHPYLPMCKKYSPQLPTAALQTYYHPNKIVEYLSSLNVDAYHPDDLIVDKKTVLLLKKSGFFVNVFTVNNPLRKKELFSWGVNGVYTDFLADYQ